MCDPYEAERLGQGYCDACGHCRGTEYPLPKDEDLEPVEWREAVINLVIGLTMLVVIIGLGALL